MYSTREEVENWLIKMQIKNYVINEDLTVNVNESVDISYKKLVEIPVQFGIVKSHFHCNHNELTSLEGCPEVVNGRFF